MDSRTLSLNRPPNSANRNNRTKSRRVMSKRASSLNRPPNSANRTRMNRLGSVVRSVRRRAGSVGSSMRSALSRVGPAINSMRLTRGSERRHRNRKNKIRYDILENEIVKTINETPPEKLKKELLRKLDEKLNFKIHSEDDYQTYSCNETEENKRLLHDYIFVTGQLYFSYDGIIQQILKEVTKQAEVRILYCTPTEPPTGPIRDSF